MQFVQKNSPEVMKKKRLQRFEHSIRGDLKIFGEKKHQQLLRASLLTTRVSLNPRMHPTAMYEASEVVVSSQSNIEELNSPPLETSWDSDGEKVTCGNILW